MKATLSFHYAIKLVLRLHYGQVHKKFSLWNIKLEIENLIHKVENLIRLWDYIIAHAFWEIHSCIIPFEFYYFDKMLAKSQKLNVRLVLMCYHPMIALIFYKSKYAYLILRQVWGKIIYWSIHYAFTMLRQVCSKIFL